jgi:hypothetical protein
MFVMTASTGCAVGDIICSDSFLLVGMISGVDVAARWASFTTVVRESGNVFQFSFSLTKALPR